MDSHVYEPAVFYVTGDLAAFRDRLKKGQTVDGRIVLCLGSDKYLLRILGHNLVMESHLNFNRFDNVRVRVRQVSPKLQLMLCKQKNNYSRARGTDIIV